MVLRCNPDNSILGISGQSLRNRIPIIGNHGESKVCTIQRVGSEIRITSLYLKYQLQKA